VFLFSPHIPHYIEFNKIKTMFGLLVNGKTYFFNQIFIKKPCIKMNVNWYLMHTDLNYFTFKIEKSGFSAKTSKQSFSISSFDCVFEFKTSYSKTELLHIEMFFFRNRFKDFEINENGLLQLV
jgi:hypothetical protein